MSKKGFKIINSDGDFHQIQNYVLQLRAEKRITSDAYVLYGFYRSVSGWDDIGCGYKYISKNTGLSVGSISKSNQILRKAGLIKVVNRGKNNPYEIVVKANRDLVGKIRQVKVTGFSDNKLHGRKIGIRN